jgi:transposase
MEQCEPEDLIFIDESGANLNMDSAYGRAQGGRRVNASKPHCRGTTVSIIGAMSLLGVVAAMYGEWATDGIAFLTFIQTMLVPQLRAGHIVIMDNASFHKIKQVREAIESSGARLVFLPPYSPDFSPIELMWSKLKQYLRKKAARTLGSFHQALLEAFETLTDYDFEGWFAHCGYDAS